MNAERGASLRGTRRDLGDNEECEDIDLDKEEVFESEEGGVELENVAMTRVEMDEFLPKHDLMNTEEEEVIGNVLFVNVGGQPRCFLMPFVVHKTVMTKEVLVCMLDTHFVDENPMVIGHDET